MGTNGSTNRRAENKSASRRPTKSASERNRVEWNGFIDVSLTDAQKDAFRAWRLETETDLPDLLAGIAVAGHKVTLNYVQSNDSFSASITGSLKGDPAFAQTVSAFGRDVITALQMICFKHYVIAQEDWSAVESAARIADEFG